MAHVSGVMLGRAAYHEPLLLAEVDARFFGDARPVPDLRAIIGAMADYAERELAGARGSTTSPGTCSASPTAGRERGRFRQILSVDAAKRGAGPDVLWRAFEAVGPELQLAV